MSFWKRIKEAFTPHMDDVGDTIPPATYPLSSRDAVRAASMGAASMGAAFNIRKVMQYNKTHPTLERFKHARANSLEIEEVTEKFMESVPGSNGIGDIIYCFYDNEEMILTDDSIYIIDHSIQKTTHKFEM